jgi:hypothetical protein
MALKKVKRPVLKGELEAMAKAQQKEDVEATATEEVKEVKTNKSTVAKKKAPAKKVKEVTETVEPETDKDEVVVEEKSDKKTANKKPTKATTNKKVNKKAPIIKPVSEPIEDDEEDKSRATKKGVMKKTQRYLEENEGITISLENLTTIINAFEAVLTEVTNNQSYKFMGGMIQVQKRNGQVFKSPKVDYFSYKAPRTVKTFTQDTEQVDKYKGQYDPETKIFKADGKWNYETKEFDPVDIEIVVGSEDE